MFRVIVYFKSFISPQGASSGATAACYKNRDLFIKNSRKLLPGMRLVFGSLGNTLAAAIPAIRAVLPRAVFCDAAYAGVSYGTWDGKIEFLKRSPSRHVMVFGADSFAAQSNIPIALKVTVAHELAHSCHFNALKLTLGKFKKCSLAQLLWIEGFAGYLAGRIAWPASLTGEGCPWKKSIYSDNVSGLASGFLKVSGRTVSDERQLQRWFGTDPCAEIPPKAAYYLGWRLIGELEGKHGLPTIMRWPLGKAGAVVNDWLGRLGSDNS
ncbi:MAG: DUF2268 domain-containing putative Zn-dependent protease [Elusimicrobiota bacterium]|nr:DUF2268 domain-containing putative Zn-dependent protease [Elusimicrobiota bacterium]